MNQQQRTIPIFFGIDDKYAPYLSVTLQSLLSNRAPETRYEITVLYQTLSITNQTKLQALVPASCSLTFVSLDADLYERFDGDRNTLRADYFTLTIYYRLFIAELFPQYQRAIYLDSDTIVTQDLGALYDLDLGDNVIGAIPDAFICNHPEPRRYAEMAIGVDPDHYINSGVLLMDLAALRTQHFSQKFLELLNQYHFELIAPDQDYLNAICYGKTRYLSPKWNAQTEYILAEIKLALPAIIHFNLFGKPWCYDDIPFEDEFWKYARLSPYYAEIASFKADYAADKIKHDREKKELLVARISSIPDTAVTFKKVAAKGVTIQL
ncbi:glycosyltransferase family 8 protein [Lapidilactobacillus luobeiensis]|uniref:glycosyltransferase family 8 protein n=1 Tax=Lapidilactobacillus luobeiensis TaxID=2950371 RepID=UPI0021C29DCD|nr:glycosyltransferase family 8 protein [Lapidilactobacillus luobeiensis]